MRTEKAYQKSEELVQLQIRLRRRKEKAAWETPYEEGIFKGITPRELWDEVGAHWASVDKLRVKVNHTNVKTAMATAENNEIELAIEQVRRQQRGKWKQYQMDKLNAIQGNATPQGGFILRELDMARHEPEVKDPGIRNPGVDHFAVSNGMAGRGGYRVEIEKFGPRDEDVRVIHVPTVGRGRGDLHGGRHGMSAPKGDTSVIEAQERKIARLEKEYDQATGKARKLLRHKLHFERLALEEMRIERANGGLTMSARIRHFGEQAGDGGKAYRREIREHNRAQARL